MEQTALHRFASKVSVFFNPLVIGVPVILLIGIKDQGEIRMDLMPTVILCVSILCCLPLIYILFLLRTGVVKDFHITDRRQRIYLFPFVILCFVVVLVILSRTENVSRLVKDLLLVGFVSCLICALITVWYKISLHCAGLGWLTVGLSFSFGTAGTILGLAGLALAAWSRLVLKEHTFYETLSGTAFGIASTWAGIRLLS